MPVDTPRKDYFAYLDRWSRARDCSEGSDSVKARGSKYLPLLESHKKNFQKYQDYVLRAMFFNATGRTIEGLSGAIFQKTPVFKIPKTYDYHIKDITLTGTPAELFALKTTREVLTTGREGVLVDMSVDQRPYWVGYHAEDIISWVTDRTSGKEILTRVVLRETYDEQDPKDPFVSECKIQHRVLELQEGQYVQVIWQKASGSNTYAVVSTTPILRRGVPLDFIPFVFIGPTSNSATIEKPPLLDLIDVNLSHYRTMADLEHGRHFTALPTPWVAGAAPAVEGQDSEPLEIGSGTAWMLGENGKAGMLEFSGAGLTSLVTAEQDKRKMMAVLGARLLEEQSGSAETATAVGMRHAGTHATLRTIAQSIEQGLTKALEWHVWWMTTLAKPVETDALMSLNKEFFTVKASPQEVQVALAALQAEEISFATFYNILQTGGWAREGITPDDEKKQIEKESELYGEPEPLNPDIPDGQDMMDENGDMKPAVPGQKKPPVNPGQKKPPVNPED